MSQEKKIALVTGASRGIGAVIATTLAEQGAFVIGTATSNEGADNISKYIEEKGLNGKGYCLNVTDPQAIESVVGEIQKEYGVPTILVNNAGITRDNLMLRMKPEEWEEVIRTNLNALYYISKASLKGMIKQRFGRIINISSVVGCTGNGGQANYAAAKAGMIGFTKSLAQEVASRNITVNVVAPGFIDTDMTRALNDEQREAILAQVPMQRLGEARDIADAVGFLASDQASYITGQTIHINGGMYMA